MYGRNAFAVHVKSCNGGRSGVNLKLPRGDDMSIFFFFYGQLNGFLVSEDLRLELKLWLPFCKTNSSQRRQF